MIGLGFTAKNLLVCQNSVRKIVNKDTDAAGAAQVVVQ